MSTRRYEVKARRDGDWWSLVAQVGRREVASQTRLLSKAEMMIKEAIALALDVDADSFEVTVTPQLPRGEAGRLAKEAASLRQQHEAAGQRLTETTARAVRSLRDRGYSVRDIAHLIGLTPGRVSQIEHGKR